MIQMVINCACSGRRLERSMSGKWCHGMAVVLVWLALGGAGACGGRSPAQLTPAEALQLAVTLANAKCQATFSHAPFDSTRYGLERVDGVWRWGGLDLASVDGFSADVRFDGDGGNQHVEVTYSNDIPKLFYAPRKP